MPTFSSLLTMWIINKYYVKVTESFSLSKLFKLFQILDAVRVDYMSNMQKLPWSQECCTEIPSGVHAHLSSTIKNQSVHPIIQLGSSHDVRFFHATPDLDVQVQDQLEASKAFPKLHSCVHRIQGDSDVMGGLGRNVFPPKKWLVNLSFVPFLAKQSSESTVHQSLTAYQTCSTLLWSDPVCILWNSLKNQVK